MRRRSLRQLAQLGNPMCLATSSHPGPTNSGRSVVSSHHQSHAMTHTLFRRIRQLVHRWNCVRYYAAFRRADRPSAASADGRCGHRWLKSFEKLGRGLPSRTGRLNGGCDVPRRTAVGRHRGVDGPVRPSLRRSHRHVHRGGRRASRRQSGVPGMSDGRSGQRSALAVAPIVPPLPGTPVVILSDLNIPGCGGQDVDVDGWLRLDSILRSQGSSLLIFVPFPPLRWPARLRRHLRLIPWDRPTTPSSAVRAMSAGQR